MSDDAESAAEVLAELTGKPVVRFDPDVPIPDFEDQEVLIDDS